MMSGGITRLKQHLVGGYNNISKCKSCLTIIHDQMRELLNGIKSKKSDRTKRDERFKKILFNKGESEPILVADSDDDTMYPLDCQIHEERDMYRRAIMESRNKNGIENKFRDSMVLEVSLTIEEMEVAVVVLMAVHRKIWIKALQECLEHTVKGMTI